MSYPIIDVHQHVYTVHELGNLVSINNNFNVVLGVVLAQPYRIENYLENYPQYNKQLAYSVCFWNSEMGVTYKQVPGKVSELARNKSIISIGELTGVYWNRAHTDTCYEKLYATADTFSLSVSIHTGILPYDMIEDWPKYSNEFANPATVEPVIKKYHNVNFNLMHFGYDWNKEYDYSDNMFDLIVRYENVYFDIAATVWSTTGAKTDTEIFIKRVIDAGYEDRILLGSDYPWANAISSSVNFIKDADFLTPVQKKKILYWNAANYLRLSDEVVNTHFVIR